MRISSCSALAGLFLAVAGPLSAGPVLRIMPAGDELTAGVPSNRGSYRVNLEDLLEDAEVLHDFVGPTTFGSGIDDGEMLSLSLANGVADLGTAITDSAPDVVLLSTGIKMVGGLQNWVWVDSNNVGHVAGPTPTAGDWAYLETKLDDLFTAINDQLPSGAKVIIRAQTGIRYDQYDVQGGPVATQNRIATYNSILAQKVGEQVAAGNDYIFSSTTLGNYSDYSGTRWYLSTAGEDRLGQMWYNDLSGCGLLTPPTPPSGPNIKDFDGDGYPDIFRRNVLDIEMEILFQQDTTTVSAEATDFTISTPLYRFVGTGDFDGDGKADLLVRRASDGKLVIYFMDGTTRLSTGVANFLPAQDWKVKAVEDFNGDGKADILMRHSVNGVTILHHMDGTTRLEPGVRTDYRIKSLVWDPVGAGDFDGDGNPDILWRNYTSGKNNVHLMDGASRVGNAVSTYAVSPQSRVAGVADMDRDGIADVVYEIFSIGYGVGTPGHGWRPTIYHHSSPSELRDISSIDGGVADINWEHIVH